MHLLGITQNNFDSLWLLVVIANVSTLLPLPFLNWLPAGEVTQLNTPKLQPVPAIDADANASKQMEQPFLPELVSEFVPQSLLREPAEEPAE